MKLLMFGDLAPTGFGTVTVDLGRELLGLGLDVRFVSQNELGELVEPFRSRTIVVNEERSGWLYAVQSGHMKIEHLLDGTLTDGWQPDAVLMTADFYAARAIVFGPDGGPEAFAKIPTFHYCPIEGEGLPPAWKRLWDIVTPIAMSEFGAREIAKVTGSLPPVIYHGVDTDVFHPATRLTPVTVGGRAYTSRDEAREYFGWPTDLRICLRTDTNMPRKRYPSLLRAMAPVLAAKPDTALVWHCRTHDEGTNLGDERSKYPPEIARRMASTGIHDRYGFGRFTRDELCLLYNAADLYVSVSAEGFGLTIAEAIACGTPAVGLDYSSVPEVIGPAGRVVRRAGLVDNGYAHFWAGVDEPEFARTVATLLDDPYELERLGKRGPKHVRRSFSWSKAARQFAEVMTQREAVAA